MLNGLSEDMWNHARYTSMADNNGSEVVIRLYEKMSGYIGRFANNINVPSVAQLEERETVIG